MIVVKIELHSAITGKVTEIGRTYIANNGGTMERGDYKVAVCRRVPDGQKYLQPNTWSGRGPKPAREGEVKSYPRLSYNVWRLVIRALKSAFPEES